MRTVAAAIVGGTISELSGGKFANGAATAAMVHLFNAENGLEQAQEEEGFGETIDLVQEAIDAGENLESGKFFGSIDDFDPDVQQALDARNVVTFHDIKQSSGQTTGRFENTGPIAWIPVINAKGEEKWLKLGKTISGTFTLSNKALALDNLIGIRGYTGRKWNSLWAGMKLLGFPRVGKFYTEDYGLWRDGKLEE